VETIEKIWPQWKGVELIGQGQFGHVYKVKREDFGNVFYSAVKIIHIPNETSSIQELKNSGMDQISIQKYFHSQVKELMNEIKVMELYLLKIMKLENIREGLGGQSISEWNYWKVLLII